MQTSDGPLQITRATSLDEVYKTLRPSPLIRQEELDAFYRPEVNATRGGDKMKRLRLRLNRSADDGIPFKACIMGHPGVGKSTELSRMLSETDESFCAIRFSATTALDPNNFRPLDVLLVMIIEITERTGELAGKPSDESLKKVWQWFSVETKTQQQNINLEGSISGGAGVSKDSLWNKVLGLFASIKGEMKFASTRSAEVVEYRLRRIKDLLPIANDLIHECNLLLKNTLGKEWLFIGEDFDKAGISNERIEELFITYANLFSELKTHLIFNIPIGLYYSSGATRLPFPPECSLVIPDTQVYDAEGSAKESGYSALHAVLSARMDTDLFLEGQIQRVILASGGNLRDLFHLVSYAADTAILNEESVIGAEDVSEAIANLRSIYERRLGQSPYDVEEITYDDKATRLVDIYGNNREAYMTDRVLYSLLLARAVQEFSRDSDGERWFGIHPLVIDILVIQGRLIRSE
ncbi:MAG: hypothetical protein AAFV85_25920 [Cyanobacteria bacterium J06634_6]